MSTSLSAKDLMICVLDIACCFDRIANNNLNWVYPTTMRRCQKTDWSFGRGSRMLIEVVHAIGSRKETYVERTHSIQYLENEEVKRTTE